MMASDFRPTSFQEHHAPSPRASLSSTPLAAMTIAALTLWGCGSDNPPPMDGGGGAIGDGGAGRGGGGGSAGRAERVAPPPVGAAGWHRGTGGSTAGTGGGTGGGRSRWHGRRHRGHGGRRHRGPTGGGTAGSRRRTAGSTGGGTAGTTGGSTAGTGGGTAGATGGSTAARAEPAPRAQRAARSRAPPAAPPERAAPPPPASTARAARSPGSINGVCANGVCTNCAADSACTTAYGAMQICLGTGAAATCVMGDCHQNAECNGRLCNTSTNFCTNCTNSTPVRDGFGREPRLPERHVYRRQLPQQRRLPERPDLQRELAVRELRRTSDRRLRRVPTAPATSASPAAA